jgi:hypothetical protein
MNKKILLSAAAAALMTVSFTGCGSDNDTVATTATPTTDTAGYVTLSDGTVVGASKGALSGAGVTKSGTTVTATGGTDVITDEEFDGSVKSDTELTDSEGRVIANTFTSLAVDSGEDNVTTAFSTIAAKLGFSTTAILKVFQATSSDAAKENLARLVWRQMVKADESGISKSVLFSVMENATTGYASVLAALNNVTSAENDSALLDMIANITANPTSFAATLSAIDANSSVDFNTSLASNAISYPGLILETNTTTTADSTMISRIDDSNDSVDYTNSSDLNETVELLISMSNAAATGINANASYAAKLSNLVPVSVGGYLTNFVCAPNSNSTLTVTANSNLSKGLTLENSDLNISALMANLITADSGSGMDVNLTAFVDFVTDEIGALANGGTNGNYTSGMEASGTFNVKVLANVNDNNFTTSDQAWLIEKDSIVIGTDADTAATGSTYAGYKLIDNNLTK